MDDLHVWGVRVCFVVLLAQGPWCMAGHMSGLVQQQATPSRAGHLSCLSLFDTLHSLCGTISAVHIPLPGAHQLFSLGGVMSASCVLAAAVVFALFQEAVCGGVCDEDQHWAPSGVPCRGF